MKIEPLSVDFDVICPYCGSDLCVEIDVASGTEDFVEDCHVCCAPILFRVIGNTLDGVTGIEAIRENG